MTGEHRCVRDGFLNHRSRVRFAPGSIAEVAGFAGEIDHNSAQTGEAGQEAFPVLSPVLWGAL